jgi:2-polyprenyl-6-methoxyphenol hydroxylase-like FAD-dependent oxidoreductase
VAQIEMPGWSHHHVVLVGDACQCVSLAAGQGASLAMAGAYILAEEMARHENDLPRALLRYEARVKPAITNKQRAGRRTIKWFAPDSNFRIAIRDFAMRLAGYRWGQYFFKRFLDTESILS